ncbi:MAG: tRNA (guanosine(37)-N1)-methyltransferase TrmD [Bdellovibrio sp.]
MTKKIWVITMFPEIYTPFVETGVVGQALRGERGMGFELKAISLRNFSVKDYKGVDDSPFGGGVGMVMRADVLKNALIEGIVKPGNYGEDFKNKLHIVYTTARGNQWNDQYARDFAQRNWSDEANKDLVFICGRYEGIDERFIELYVDERICIGDYILSSGDLATLCIIDSALRFSPGVLGNKLSAQDESFAGGMLEHPHYTKPRVFEGLEVPEVLLSGNHQKIEKYRLSERERMTKLWRPDLLKSEKKK